MAILPNWYQEVEYIQSTATDPWSQESSWQYIDTLVTINKNIKVDIDMQFTSLAVQSRLFWWLYDSWSSWITFSPYINWSTQWARATANWVGNWQSTNVAANTNRNRFVLDNTRYIIYDSNWTQVHNWTNSSTISNSDTWTIPLLASKDRSLNKVNRHSSAKLYWCKIWDNDVLVRDFVPCYRKSDNEIWLYDLVNNQFYTNSWTGSFIKWPRILPDWKIKKIYLGTDLIRPSSKTTEYVLLSEWWSVNKFSELSLNGVTCVSNNTSNWLGNVTSTDKFWIHYKVFDKPIVWFEIKMAASYASWDYREIRAYLTPSASNINTNDQRFITAWIQIRLRSQVYQWNSTWDVLIWTVGGTGSISQNKSVAAATGIMKWTMNSSGIWDLSIELSNWQSWTWQIDTSAIWDLYMIWFQGRRWYTWNTWTFYSAKVELLDS